MQLVNSVSMVPSVYVNAVSVPQIILSVKKFVLSLNLVTCIWERVARMAKFVWEIPSVIPPNKSAFVQVDTKKVETNAPKSMVSLSSFWGDFEKGLTAKTDRKTKFPCYSKHFS